MGLGHDDLESVQRLAYRLGNIANETQIGRPVGPRRRSHRDENGVGGLDGRRKVSREGEPAGLHVLANQSLQPRFVDRNLAPLQAFDLIRILVDADHFHAEVGKACSRDQPDVAGSNYADSHGSLKGK